MTLSVDNIVEELQADNNVDYDLAESCDIKQARTGKTTDRQVFPHTGVVMPKPLSIIYCTRGDSYVQWYEMDTWWAYGMTYVPSEFASAGRYLKHLWSEPSKILSVSLFSSLGTFQRVLK